MPSHQIIDATGLACPLPLLKLKQALHSMAAGEQVVLIASDVNSLTDIKRFCEIAGHSLEIISQENQLFEFLIQKKNS
ncbi:sulfurtransferase TusA family protein [Alkanindiges illinoisensis]|uniref:sulfurtransferase TusA family protein n=1 Tax=Alkanindiges illinoisensis TaxID=197183 RepID=UPI00047E9A0C|nr:sulfurtransferase TusA family protein [Alkanindiges illinoisensis]